MQVKAELCSPPLHKKAPEPWRSQEPIVYLEVCDTGYRIGAVGTLAAGFEPAAGSDGVAVLGPG